MAPARGKGGGRFSPAIWPGFVDAMTALILVLFFVLSIFMIVQFVLRDTVTGQARRLDELAGQVNTLGDALGLARAETDRQSALVATLAQARDAAEGRIAEAEAQAAALLAQNRDLAGARDAQAEAARLAAARAEALEAVTASLKAEAAAKGEKLSAAEAERLTEAAAAAELRKRLEGSQAELTALTLSLEAERKRAQETLTLLAAAEAARDRLQGDEARQLTDAERQAAELAQAQALLAQEKQVSDEGRREVALLNQQTAELRRQLDGLQGLLDSAADRDADAKVRIETLGANLNAALARVASEESRRAELEARERARLEAEAVDLRRYRSEFFGRLGAILGSREGVQVVGDRFVFPSEVLFAPGSATLAPKGQAQVARVAEVLRQVADQIPPEIPWVLRVDGHTDRTPLSPGSPFRDNWELSQARALSVVRFLIEREGFPADRLAATGFGEFQPIDTGDGPEALAKNRRIELKLTER